MALLEIRIDGGHHLFQPIKQFSMQAGNLPKSIIFPFRYSDRIRIRVCRVFLVPRHRYR